MDALYQRVYQQFAADKEGSQKKLLNYQLLREHMLFDEILSIYTGLAYVVRYYLCNISKAIQNNDQVHLLKAVSQLVMSLREKEKIVPSQLALVNLVLGNERWISGSHFEKVQILKASMQRYGADNSDQCQMDNEQYIPFAIVSGIYEWLRADYATILKSLIGVNEAEGFNYDSWSSTIMTRLNQESKFDSKQKKRFESEKKNILRYLVLPSINTFGPSYFNGKLEDKGKEEQAYGVLWDQYRTIFSSLTSKEVSVLEG